MAAKKFEACPRCGGTPQGCGNAGATHLIYTGGVPLRFLPSPTFEINPSKRWVGLEPELYVGNCRCAAVSALIRPAGQPWSERIGGLMHWNDPVLRFPSVPLDQLVRSEPWVYAKSDGSIGGGLELNTSPMNGDRLIQATQILGDALEADGAYVINNCSMHVHVNGMDLTGGDLVRLSELWWRVGPAAWMAVRPDRRLTGAVTYCRAYTPSHFVSANINAHWGPTNSRTPPTRNSNPAARSAPILAWDAVGPEGFFKTPSGGQGLRLTVRDFYITTNSTKYWDMSYNSLGGNGAALTVEFRLMHGLTDGRAMGYWGAIMAAIVDTAVAGRNARNLAEFLAGIPEDPRRALLQITPRHMRYWLTRQWHKYTDSPGQTLAGVPDYGFLPVSR